MEDKKLYEPLFPKGFDYLNKNYRNFQQVLNAIDYELDNNLKDKGPNPKPAPSGELFISPELRQNRIEFLETTREKRVQGFKNRIQNQIDSFDDKQKHTINDRFDFETNRNGFKDYSIEDLKTVKDMPKEDKASFDFMAANYFEKYQVSDKSSIADEKENMEMWTDRYLNLLNDWEGHNNPSGIEDVNDPELHTW